MRSNPATGGMLAPPKRTRAFTLIEIMVVCAIIGIILAVGVPAFTRIWNKEGMRKAISDFTEVCVSARGRAILSGQTTDLMFHPRDGTFEISGGGSAPAAPTFASGTAGKFDNDITIEMLDINLLEYKDSDWARVRFFPDGKSDELTLILRSNKGEWFKITLEVTTGIVNAEPFRR